VNLLSKVSPLISSKFLPYTDGKHELLLRHVERDYQAALVQ
jgi:hypothetical protein